jgi:hypothetical protein
MLEKVTAWSINLTGLKNIETPKAWMEFCDEAKN